MFLSHKTGVKKAAAGLKDDLKLVGVSAFVAHEDIRPTRAWQEEIENALLSMDAFVAVMTERFHESDWTDQEVGFALARGVPVIALRVGRDPYGFLYKFQALTSDWDTAAEGIVKLLINRDRMFSAYVQALRSCAGWDDGNVLARILPGIEKLSPQQVDELVGAYNENSELRRSFGFNGKYPSRYGEGIVPHLNRLGMRDFALDDDNFLMPKVKRKRRAIAAEDSIPF